MAMLTLYESLLAVQERISNAVGQAPWLVDAPGRQNGATPAVDLAAVPARALLVHLDSLLAELPDSTTDILRARGAELVQAEEHARVTMLQTFLATRGAAFADDPQAEFFLRVVVEPVAAALVARHGQKFAEAEAGQCPQCGGAPQVGVLRDSAGVRGERRLVCALCGTWWRFRRGTCPNCGERDPDNLPVHTADAHPGLRIEECRRCGTYLKAVDLRASGKAVPVVEDLASVELDVWCAERGLHKLARNLMGV